MKVCILMGSPRKNGNTQALLSHFSEELFKQGCDSNIFWLYDKNIAACTGCRSCQKNWSSFSCCIHDDTYDIYENVINSDLLVLATPIYSWYCTPPMKAIMDRFVYGMNKFYGEEKGPALWEGKKLATIVTCGYPPEKGADLWEQGVKRYCKHSRLSYMGMLVEHDEGYNTTFMDDGKVERAIAFAQNLCKK